VLNLLFVYGTLRSSFDNEYARLLRLQAEFVGRAVVSGSIYGVSHYPAFKPEPAGNVHGELYRLTDPEATLSALDEYEGDKFERVRVDAFAATNVSAWIYRYTGDTPPDSRIASGDFLSGDFSAQ
jgi:gamma-glutamylcyclotransferase (GGCT)/AIG2-like uncharacterized protein YtfP